MHGIGAWVVHGILAGQAGPCMVHGAWHRCMALHATFCLVGVPVTVFFSKTGETGDINTVTICNWDSNCSLTLGNQRV